MNRRLTQGSTRTPDLVRLGAFPVRQRRIDPMYRKIVLVPFVLLPLQGCTPVQVPVEVAEQQCLAQVQPPVSGGGPTTAVGISMGNNGQISTGIAFGFTAVSTPSDPVASFNQCVFSRSGQMPRTPLGVPPRS